MQWIERGVSWKDERWNGRRGGSFRVEVVESGAVQPTSPIQNPNPPQTRSPTHMQTHATAPHTLASPHTHVHTHTHTHLLSQTTIGFASLCPGAHSLSEPRGGSRLIAGTRLVGTMDEYLPSAERLYWGCFFLRGFLTAVQLNVRLGVAPERCWGAALLLGAR